MPSQSFFVNYYFFLYIFHIFNLLKINDSKWKWVLLMPKNQKMSFDMCLCYTLLPPFYFLSSWTYFNRKSGMKLDFFLWLQLFKTLGKGGENKRNETRKKISISSFTRNKRSSVTWIMRLCVILKYL